MDRQMLQQQKMQQHVQMQRILYNFLILMQMLQMDLSGVHVHAHFTSLIKIVLDNAKETSNHWAESSAAWAKAFGSVAEAVERTICVHANHMDPSQQVQCIVADYANFSHFGTLLVDRNEAWKLWSESAAAWIIALQVMTEQVKRMASANSIDTEPIQYQLLDNVTQALTHWNESATAWAEASRNTAEAVDRSKRSCVPGGIRCFTARKGAQQLLCWYRHVGNKSSRKCVCGCVWKTVH